MKLILLKHKTPTEDCYAIQLDNVKSYTVLKNTMYICFETEQNCMDSVQKLSKKAVTNVKITKVLMLEAHKFIQR